ncbi:hypothetical protein CsatA_029099 [Cannabis sativa]
MVAFTISLENNSCSLTVSAFAIMGSFAFVWMMIFVISFSNLHFPTFSHSPNNLTLFGDAFFSNASIVLTQELNSCSSSSLASFNGVGGALYADPVRFVDSQTNDTASFSSVFSFSITPSPFCSPGDGISFLIAPDQDSFSSFKGHIGLPRPFVVEDPFFAVEYDTSFDPLLGDVNGNHIGVDLNSVVSVSSVDLTPKGVNLKSGKTIKTWIEYRNPIKMIRIWVGYSAVRPTNPVLVARLDLSQILKEYMYVGFSSSNGQGSSLHVLDKWRFKIYHGSFTIPLDIVEEGDCFVCSPDDEHSATATATHKSEQEKFVLGVGCLVTLVISIIAIVLVVIFKKIQERKIVVINNNNNFGANPRIQTRSSVNTNFAAERIQANRVPTRLSLAEIKSATMCFAPNRIVGEGASATVYKGSLPHGPQVAVKRFQRVSGIGSWRNPFTTEFATMVGCLKHKNLIQLQGWCCEGSELVLVYEYMPNGSLDKILHNKTRSAIVLTWTQRQKISIGVASALTYLHQDCERQIIHRDVKSCNIMLDENFNAKLGDFGLAQVYEHSPGGGGGDHESRNATIPAGTLGYLAPEYVYTGVPSSKTDAYSFGVVVLELVTGKRAVDEDGKSVVDWVWELWGKGMIVDAADVRLRGKVKNEELMRMLVVGLACVHPNHVKRLSVKQAARVLKGEASLPLLPPCKPRFKLRPVNAVPSESSSAASQTSKTTSNTDPFLTPMTNFG